MDNFEKIGMAELDKLAVVLIAGGLGERLGYSGIKISLPLTTLQTSSGSSESGSTTSWYSYLRYYASYVQAIEVRA